MNKKFFYITLLIACITLLLCSLFCIHVQLQKEKVQLEVNVNDTLRFRVQTLENEINVLHVQRFALISDTARIYHKYEQLVSRINTATTEKQQYETLKELTGKPEPKIIDANLKIAEGILCCDLLLNTKAQLTISDSVSALQDSVITTQKIELDQFKTGLNKALNETKAKDQAFAHEKAKLRRWRGFALLQTVAIATAISIYKLSH